MSATCRALIVYRPPGMFTYLELAILKHGTYAEFRQVLSQAMMRSLSIPKHLITEPSWPSPSADHTARPNGNSCG